jgi:acyl transferase domain-containing protein
MAAPDDPNFDAGSMLAVMGKVEKLEADVAEFPDVVMANLNSKKQVVLAGPTDSILKAHDALKEKKYTVVKLPVSAAFHTPLVGHAQKPFAKAIREVKFHKPQIPVYSNATSKAYPSPAKTIQKQLESHILNSVHFSEEIENIHQDGGRFVFEWWVLFFLLLGWVLLFLWCHQCCLLNNVRYRFQLFLLATLLLMSLCLRVLW